MFDDLDQVDWAGLNAQEVPNFIRRLVSNDPAVRNLSFHELLDTYIYERPDLACEVVPYILRILENREINGDTGLLIEFLRAMYSYAHGFVERDMGGVEDSRQIISDIENAKDIIRNLSENPLTRDTALHLITDIEHK